MLKYKIPQIVTLTQTCQAIYVYEHGDKWRDHE